MPTPSKLYMCALALAVGLFVLNWVVHWFTGFAPAYCWGRHLAAPFWDLWAQPLFTLLALGFIITLFMGKLGMAFKAAVIMVLVAGLPQFMGTLYGLGSTCHA